MLRGRGDVTATFTSTAQLPVVAPAPAGLAPPPSPPLHQLLAQASSLQALLSAAADPAVSAILLRAHIALGGSAVALSRALSLTADAEACNAQPFWGRALPAGVCALDAGGASRHFEARPPMAAHSSGLPPFQNTAQRHRGGPTWGGPTGRPAQHWPALPGPQNEARGLPAAHGRCGMALRCSSQAWRC